MPQKSARSVLSMLVLIMALSAGCRPSSPPAESPDHQAIQTQGILQQTGTVSYFQTHAARFLAQATDEATAGSSSGEAFPYAPCAIFALAVAVTVGIYARSGRQR